MNPVRRVRATLVALVAMTTIASGVAVRALGWPASPAAGGTLAAAGLVALVGGGLALRIIVVLDRHQ